MSTVTFGFTRNPKAVLDSLDELADASGFQVVVLGLLALSGTVVDGKEYKVTAPTATSNAIGGKEWLRAVGDVEFANPKTGKLQLRHQSQLSRGVKCVATIPALKELVGASLPVKAMEANIRTAIAQAMPNGISAYLDSLKAEPEDKGDKGGKGGKGDSPEGNDNDDRDPHSVAVGMATTFVAFCDKHSLDPSEIMSIVL